MDGISLSDEEEGGEQCAQLCRALLSSSAGLLAGHVPSYAEYVVWAVRASSSPVAQCVWRAATDYLFLRVSERELLQQLESALLPLLLHIAPQHRAQATKAFLSELRQRRCEYFAHNWDQLDAITECNAQDYRDWRKLPAHSTDSEDELDTLEQQHGIITIDPDDWEQLQRTAATHVLLVHFAPFCSWCRMLDPVLRQLHKFRLLQARVDGSLHVAFARKMGVRRFPELDLWYQGQRVSRFSLKEPSSVEALTKWLTDNGVVSSDSDPQLRWRMLLPKEIVDHLRNELHAHRRIASLRESLRAMGCSVDLADEDNNVNPLSPFSSPDATCPAVPDTNEAPVLILLGGGLGAGKSSLLLSLREEEFWLRRGNSIVCVEADSFKHADPLFNELAKISTPTQAARVCHRESTDAAETLLLQALQAGRDVVFDGTCKWAPFVRQTVAMARQAHEYRFSRGYGFRSLDDELYWQREEPLYKCNNNVSTCDDANNCTFSSEECAVDGNNTSKTDASSSDKQRRRPYRIWLIASHCAVPVSVGRAVRRSLLDGRGVAVRDVLLSHRRFATHFEEYASLVDRVILFDNTRSRPLEVAPPIIAEKREGEELRILDTAAYERFRKVATLNVEAINAASLFSGPDIATDVPQNAHGASVLEVNAAPLNPEVERLFGWTKLNDDANNE